MALVIRHFYHLTLRKALPLSFHEGVDHWKPSRIVLAGFGTGDLSTTDDTDDTDAKQKWTPIARFIANYPKLKLAAIHAICVL
jgi:hypothetical protein